MMGVSVALCTYNGERFLRQQLESIATQTLPPAEVVACDDCSGDRTVKILEAFAASAPFPVRIYCNGERLGAAANYSRALGLCRGDYAALCDQDDVWLPEKLEVSLKALREAEELYGQRTPLLLHGDLKVVGAFGELLSPSFMGWRKIRHVDEDPLRTLLVQNFVTGCTVLANRALMEAALPIPREAAMHDWWMALVAALAGKIIFLREPMVLYRQHGRNVIGASGFFSGKTLKRLLDLGQLEEELGQALFQVLALYGRFFASGCGGEYGSKAGWFREVVEGIAGGGKNALRAFRKHRVRKQGALRNLVLYLLLLRYTFRKGC